jgi:hypothetical protein
MVPVAWVLVIAAFAYKSFIFISPLVGTDVSWLKFSQPTLVEMKRNLSSWRLLHTLGVALIVANYFPSNSRVMRWRASGPLIWSGQHSLEIFSMSVVLDTICNIVELTYRPSAAGTLLMVCLAVASMGVTAFALSRATSPVRAAVSWQTRNAK